MCIRDRFHDLNSPFMLFFDGIENASNCRAQFILSCLPFCQGTPQEKAELVWIYNEDAHKEGVIEGRRLGEYVGMIVRLATRVVGRMIGKGEQIDSDLKLLMEASDEDIEKCVTDLFGHTLGIEITDNISRSEYEKMLKEIGNSDLFSSRYLRKSFLASINNKH
eukprot:TRINITY_DN3218_c0_g1_i14.p1 TRINITY_DN3218_c0_g1~~TRINITY_DN3218_c0_g1_i14.p1  ORF type:complete len:164 (-),score=60.50 TRINITY_DN3218_c0_g1_i14:89-580(-)